MRRLGLLLVLVVVLVAAAGAWADRADAYSGGPNSPMTNPANLARVKSLLRDVATNPSPYGTNTATGSAATAAEVETGLTAARSATGVLPAMGVLGGTLAVAAAGYTGWQIGTFAGGRIYKKLTGETYGGSLANLTLTGVKWNCYNGGSTWRGCTSSNSNTQFFNQGTAYPPGWYLAKIEGSGGEGFCSVGFTTCQANAQTQFSALAATFAGVSGTIEFADNPGAPAGTCQTIYVTPYANCALLRRTQKQYERALKIEQSTASAYASAALKKDSSSFQEPATSSDADVQAGLDEIGANDGATGSPSEEAAADAINHALDPGWSHGDGSPNFTPFILPQPQPSETYTAYAARLRAAGWLGTLTATAETTLEATASAGTAYQLAPLSAPTAITISGLSPVLVYDPANGHLPTPEWPDNPPHVPTATTPITIRYKPPSSVWPPDGGGSGSCDCTVEPLDFSPLSGITTGDSFPFGFIGFAGDVVGHFDVSPETPEFDFVINGGEIGGHAISGGGDYNVSLDVMDTYMGWIRTLLSVILWIGAVYLLATRLLGFGAGGDPGEAADEGTWGA
jgi:hypothetical protein